MTTGEVIALIKAFGGGSGGGSSGGGVLVLHEDENGTLDKTWQEIHDALGAGTLVTVVYVDGNDAFCTIIGATSNVNNVYGLYQAGYGPGANDPIYTASSANSYPWSN
jgi:hypothetical protein